MKVCMFYSSGRGHIQFPVIKESIEKHGLRVFQRKIKALWPKQKGEGTSKNKTKNIHHVGLHI